MKPQMQMWAESQQRLFAAHRAFMDMVNHPTNPMTNQDLERLIAQWPERYERFSGFLGTLKDEVQV